MKNAQKTVLTGAVVGVATMIAIVALLSVILPSPTTVFTIGQKLQFGLQMNLIAVLPLLAMLVVVGNSRFLSDAIDPTRHTETTLQEIDARVVDNTLQQTFVFFVGSLALATALPGDQLQILLAITIAFVLSRIAFWIGYRINPLYRAPGMAATGYLNVGVLVAAIILSLFFHL
jgi:uncharacterized MAPEG superfamily protein